MGARTRYTSEYFVEARKGKAEAHQREQGVYHDKRYHCSGEI